MQSAVEGFRYVNLVAFATLGATVCLLWLRRRSRAALWAAAGFGALGALVLLGLIPGRPHDRVEEIAGRFQLALLVLFPYLLFRFATSFRRASHWFGRTTATLTMALVAWAFALPALPRSDESWSAPFAAFVAVFLADWTLLAVTSGLRLWSAGRAQPTVARRRMQLLALASAAITLAVFLLAAAHGSHPGLQLGSQVLGTASAGAFLLGLAPPPIFRLWWSAREQARLQQAIVSLLSFATSQEEVAGRVLEPAAALVGARAIAIRNEEGRVVAAWNTPGQESADPASRPDDSEIVDLEVPGGRLVVWTSPYAPFFGDEELGQLHTLGALVGLALDRVRLFQVEREHRLALERANEVKADFVALAAHELRTPMTTIHGFVTTLHHLSDRLSEEQRAELGATLVQQTRRMALLVEQLLDLSRLDAEAIDISPEPLRIAEHVHDVVATSTDEVSTVQIDVPEDAVVEIDRNALDRILSNLVTNAFRYGKPPVLVRAEQTDRHFRLTVEDRGTGVAPEFVPDLFERFTRNAASRGAVAGTGLGLAIARSYARAHGGDLLYEDAEPHGARFQLVLPVDRPGRRRRQAGN